MATNKIDRINAEIEKTREKISALPLPPLPTCFPAAVFPA